MNSTEQNTPHRGRLPRSLLLAIPLGLLGVMLIAATVQAVMLSRLQTTLVHFDTGTFDRTGLLDIPDQNIHSVQLLPIGLTGDWSEAAPLPVALGDMMTAVNDDIVYVIGGEDISQYRAEVYSAIMPLTGTIASWTTQTPLPEPRKAASAVVYRGTGSTSTLYVVAGIKPGSISVNTVYRAQIDNTTGAIIGTWQDLAGERLPVAIRYPEAVVHGNYLYVLGGFHGSDVYTTVYYAAINADGSLGPFNTTSPLLTPLYDGVAVVYESSTLDTLYLIGGRNPATSTFEVSFADFQTDGSLTEWQISAGNLPIHIYAHDGVMLNGEIIIAGGIINATDLSQGISQTVKAAYVDTANAAFRLYDWCEGVPPPICTIGAWQTGGLLPEVRAFHGVASAHGSVYVIGGKNAQALVTNSVYHVTVHGTGSLYSPNGTYLSEEMRLSPFLANLHKVTWDTTFGHPGEMQLAMQFRHGPNLTSWSPWTDQIQSVNGANEYEFPAPIPDDARYFQYRAIFTTSVSNASPLLNEVEIFYELDDPDLQVRKDAGPITVTNPGADLLYHVYYTNTGEHYAPGTVITEVLPAYTTYLTGGWTSMGDNVYIHELGNVPGGDTGEVVFGVQVDSPVPSGVEEIVNNVEIDFQPFSDRAGRWIVDPVLVDNEYTFVLPLSTPGLDVRKRAIPVAGSVVSPGQHITYTIAYTNTGTRELSQGVLTDDYDPSGSYQVLQTVPPPTSGDNVWHLPNLPVGASDEIQIVVAITTTTLPNHWEISNQAYVDTPGANPALSPIVTHTVMQPPAPRVDLVVQDLAWEPATAISGRPVTFQAVIENQGNLAANPTGDDAGKFWAELYVKPLSSDPPTGPSDHDYGFHLNGECCRFDHAKNITSLAAGATTTVYFPNLLTGDSALPPGEYDVYVQIDTAYGFPDESPYWGMYAEEYESNNLWHTTIIVQPGTIYLPTVFKNAW